MVEEQGTVVLVDGSSVWVETERKSTCSGCKARNGCGQHLAEKYVSRSSKGYIKATSDWHLSEGDRVVVGISEGALLRASLLVYLLPLIFLLVAIGLSAYFQLSDGLTVLACISGLFAGFMMLRGVSKKGADVCDVRVVGLVSAALDSTGITLANSSG